MLCSIFKNQNNVQQKIQSFIFLFSFFLSSFLAAKLDFTLVLERLIGNSMKLPGHCKKKFKKKKL
jgi:hypothetical protein